MRRVIFFIVLLSIIVGMTGCGCFNGCGTYVRPDGKCADLYNQCEGPNCGRLRYKDLFNDYY
jgi:hypothetical protein